MKTFKRWKVKIICLLKDKLLLNLNDKHIHCLKLSVVRRAVGVRAAADLRRLLLPGEMGERVKVMALAREFDAPLAAFATRDQRGRLGLELLDG